MTIIKNISNCLKLKSRSKKHYGKMLSQNCSKKCSNAFKKGLLYKSYNNKKNLDIRESKPDICGYTYNPTPNPNPTSNSYSELNPSVEKSKTE